MKSEKTIGIKISHKNTEKTRKILIQKNLIRSDLKIKRDNKYSYIAIKKLTDNINDYNIVEEIFEKHKTRYNSYKQNLILNEDIKRKLPNSFDIIGNIILIKLSPDLDRYKEIIGEGLLKTYKNIKTICFVKSVSGELRTRELSMIYGEKTTSTIHNEFGIKYLIDIEKAYFSPRLANERKRISDLVEDDEIIVDMFAGIGPFSLVISKYANPKKIYLVDINKYAIKYAKKNILINNVLDKIEILNIDAINIDKYLKEKKGKVDRVIMNLPFSALKYYNKAVKILSNRGIVHYYDILNEDNIDKRITDLHKISEDNGYKIEDIKYRKIKSYSPREFYIGIDITAKKIADVA